MMQETGHYLLPRDHVEPRYDVLISTLFGDTPVYEYFQNKTRMAILAEALSDWFAFEAFYFKMSVAYEDALDTIVNLIIDNAACPKEKYETYLDTNILCIIMAYNQCKPTKADFDTVDAVCEDVRRRIMRTKLVNDYAKEIPQDSPKIQRKKREEIKWNVESIIKDAFKRYDVFSRKYACRPYYVQPVSHAHDYKRYDSAYPCYCMEHDQKCPNDDCPYKQKYGKLLQRLAAVNDDGA